MTTPLTTDFEDGDSLLGEGNSEELRLMDYTDEKILVHRAGSPNEMSGTAYEGQFGKLRGLWAAATKGTVVSSIFILLTTCVGAGTLSLPHAFSQGGIFVFTIVFFLVMVSSTD